MGDEIDVIPDGTIEAQPQPEAEPREPETEDQGGDVEGDVEAEPQQPKKDKSGYARMRDSLRKVEERNERLERMVTALIEQRQQPAVPAQQVPTEDPKPAAKDFETPEDFIEAMSEWKARRIVSESLETERAQTRHVSDIERAQAAFEARRQSLPSERFADYDDVLSSAPPVPKDVAMAILHDPNGPRVAYALAQQPDLIRRMHKMAPQQRMFELAKCAVAATPQQRPAAGGKSAPSAPPPIVPMGTRGATGVTLEAATGIRDIRAAMLARKK